MKKVIALLLALTMVFALCACGASSTTAQTATSGAVSGNYDKVNLKLSCNGTDTANDTTTAKLFADLVSKKSGGAVTITVYNNDQLASGDMQKGLELVLDGTVDMDCHSTSITAGRASTISAQKSTFWVQTAGADHSGNMWSCRKRRSSACRIISLMKRARSLSQLPTPCTPCAIPWCPSRKTRPYA